jgi:ATP-binding cassette subfamily B protein
MLFTGTIRDNIRWGRDEAADEEILAAAAAAQAHEFVSRFPDGYDTALGQGGVNLSGGQKQRLAIARALVRRPAILILDDSTSAVDMGTEARIQAALRQPAHRCTCFIIAQRISSVMDADRIVVLENGRVDAIGKHRELLSASEVYREICASQLGEEATRV